MKLADKILHLRKKKGMSQEGLAEKLNVSRQAVSRWEMGSAQPDASNILQLSKLFGVSADFLLNDEYESENDTSVTKETETKTKEKIKRIIGLCLAAAGLLGNFIIYVISRIVKVPLPRKIISSTGEIWYTWSGMGYSYKYFIEVHRLEFLIIMLWFLVVIGLLAALVNKDNSMRRKRLSSRRSWCFFI